MSMFRSQTSVAGLLRHGPERFGYLNGFENANENDCEGIRIMKWRYSLESMDLHPSKHQNLCIAYDVYIYTYLHIYIHTLYSVACLQIFPERGPFWTVPRLPSQVDASPFLSQWQSLAAPWRELQSSMSPSSARLLGIVWNIISLRFHILFHWDSERRIVKDYIQQG